MTVHRIDHAVVIDTDDVPERGGYAVVGISPYVTPAERAFLAGNFGISDYLHDPKTENRVFYSVFRVPGGRRAFVRRFARGNELRRNNTQRRLVVHTLLLGEDAWNDLYALPWLLVNARLRLEGSIEPFLLNREVPWQDESKTLPALLWDSGDEATANVSGRLKTRIESSIGEQLDRGAPEAYEMLARVITELASRSRVVLPQDATHELLTMLAWSMLPRHDRDELAWTHHDATNLSGVTFPLANAPAGVLDEAMPVATFAANLVEMNTISDESWLDVQMRTARHPLTVRNPEDLDKWARWRDALLQLRENIDASEKHVVDFMEQLAKEVKENPGAPWIDDEETLQLVWATVSDAILGKTEPKAAISTWGRRLRASGLSDVIFRAAPCSSWLARAAVEVKSADTLLWFFLAGGGEDPKAKATRGALAEWLVTHSVEVDDKYLVQLTFLVAADGSTWLHSLLELLLKKSSGLDALVEYLKSRQGGGIDLIHAAAPLVANRAHRNTLTFFRDVFVPRFEPHRLDSKLARVIAGLLRSDPATYRKFLRRLPGGVRTDLIAVLRDSVNSDPAAALPLARDVLADLQEQEGGIASAGPLAIALAHAGEPARTWFDVLLRIGRTTDQRDTEATRDFVSMLDQIDRSRLDLGGSMEKLVPLLESDQLKSADRIRALVMLTRRAWETGGTQFAARVRQLIERAPLAAAWEQVILAYAADLRHKRPADVSNLVSAFWCRVDLADMASMNSATIALLDLIQPADVQRLQNAWRPRIRSLPVCPAADRLLELLRQERSYRQEADLASREIEHGSATPATLLRLEAALARLNPGTAATQFAAEMDRYLGVGGPAVRLARLLDLFATDLPPTVRLILQTHVLSKALAAMERRRYWKDLRNEAREENLLAVGVVVRLAYAAGVRADRKTMTEFERTWQEYGRTEALDALAAGRHMRRPLQRLARAIGLPDRSALAR